ncbi:uncharacterized protein E0L32_006258 [Thyridium curvatum]|uniref:Pentatricopeptide repeat protein n=1 Tax=Thyridium curvatum TaxID=1093900 RepID=A0A507AR08_9PEZI|nr:uncharacterized protein E0L32_006258 [Thyridium curvatum]TPX13285.1 hypothetical protein E0L32_006258 [Thyridium curvatum]
MLQAASICRACLAKLRQPYCPRPTARLMSQAIAATTASAAPTDIPETQTDPRPRREPNDPRRFRKYDPLRKPRPMKADQNSKRTQPRTPEAAQTFEQSHIDCYSAEDTGFWDKFEELWSDTSSSTAEALQPEPDASSTDPVSHQHRRRPPKGLPSELQLRRSPQWKFSKVRVVRGQMAHLLRHVDPESKAEEIRRLNRWKHRLARIWKSMLNGNVVHGHNKGTRRLERLLAEGDVAAMAAAWEKLPSETKVRVWPVVMSSALQTHPDDVCDILEATYDPSVVPFYAVIDTIHFLARREQMPLPRKVRSVAPKQTPPERLCQVLEHVLSRSPKGHLLFRQRTLYLLVHKTDPKQLASLYDALAQYEHPLHTQTRLHFAIRFAKEAALKERATEILALLTQNQQLDINTPHGASLCTAILMMEEKDLDGEHFEATPAHLFNQLLELGLNPNLVTYTTIIRNLCMTKEISAAWEVYHVMLDHNIEPDIYIYSTLLNGSKLAQNFSSMRHLVRIAVDKNIREPIFWNDLLHGIFLSALIETRRKKLKPPRVVPSFPLMLQAYARVFKTEPLKPLLLVDIDRFLETNVNQAALADWNFVAQLAPVIGELPPRGDSELQEPTASTLCAMILGYIKGISRPYDIIAFYSHFRQLLQSGDPVAVRLVREQGTFVHDVVIKALCEHQGMLRVALDVVSDMLRDANPKKHAAGSGSGSGHQHPQPSVHTWSILLNGFMFQRQRQQGERILAMMRQRGVEPNAVTWNTLAAGYSRMQDVGKTVRAMQRLEAAGHEADEFTFRAFSYLQNKRAALAQMERMVQQRKERQERNAAAAAASTETASGSGNSVGDALSKLESEVEEIARMMDDEQGETAEDGDGYDYDAEERGFL